MSRPEFDHFGIWHDCWQCAGSGKVADCWEEYACFDPEEGCDECRKHCDVCKGEGGWEDEE